MNNKWISKIVVVIIYLYRWKDSCVRGQENLKGKVEKLNKEVHANRAKITVTKEEGILNLDERKSK